MNAVLVVSTQDAQKLLKKTLGHLRMLLLVEFVVRTFGCTAKVVRYVLSRSTSGLALAHLSLGVLLFLLAVGLGSE